MSKNKPKRPCGKVSIVKITTGKKYQVRLRTHKDGAGKWICIKEPILGTCADAHRRLDELCAKKDAGDIESISINSQTLQQVIEGWLETCRVQKKHSTKTIQTYRGYVVRHIYPVLGKVKMRNLTKQHCSRRGSIQKRELIMFCDIPLRRSSKSLARQRWRRRYWAKKRKQWI